MARKKKWGKVGAPHSAKRRAHLRRIAKLPRKQRRNPRRKSRR